MQNAKLRLLANMFSKETLLIKDLFYLFIEFCLTEQEADRPKN